MVFFTCNVCNESMKKNRVEKHLQQCRRCQYLSCVDCSTEFWGTDYKTHTKCITEDAKYGGKDYKPKANANKGEKKQEAWTEQVQRAIDNNSGNTKLKKDLERLKTYTNIPRKKAKFENFVKNSLRIPAHVATLLWDAISSTNSDDRVVATTSHDDSPGVTTNATTDAKHSSSNENSSDAATSENTETLRKLNKREKKLERRKEQHKEDKKEKKSKKRKRQETENVDTDVNMAEPSTNGVEKKVKKKKNQHSEQESGSVMEAESPQDTESAESATTAESRPTKFSWDDTIIAVLEKADDQKMSLKKLRKKVLGAYAAHHDGATYTEDRILAKFNKKIDKNPRLKLLKDVVALKST